MTQVVSVETKKEAVAPLNPAAASKAIVSGSAPTGTLVSGVVETKDGVELQVTGVVPFSEEPLAVIDEVVFDGIGGFLAIEDRRRGLMKAFGGDTILTLSDGSRHLVPKEVKEATPISSAVLAERKKDREAQAKALETDSERVEREKREAELKVAPGVTPKK